MKKFLIGTAAAIGALALTAPAQATVLVAGTTPTTFSAFDASTRGTLVAGTLSSQSGSSPTIQGSLTSAVYLNTLNTLDFYFQVFRTVGAGQNMIDQLNVSNYTGYSVDALVSGDGTFDGGAGFQNTNNPGTSTTTVALTPDGSTTRIDFGTNGLNGTENSAIYILRTNATNQNNLGFAVISNSTGFNVTAFQPTAAVPEPATWGLMILGFSLVGAAMRNRRRGVVAA